MEGKEGGGEKVGGGEDLGGCEYFVGAYKLDGQ